MLNSVTRKLLLSISLLLIALSSAAQADDPARLSVFVFDNGLPAGNVPVTDGERLLGATDERGALFVQLSPAVHDLKIGIEGKEPAQLKLDLIPGEVIEIIVSLTPDGPPRVAIESSNKATQGAGEAAQVAAEPVGDPGTISGYVFSSESGEPVAEARIFVAGTPLDLRTDAEGRFTADVAPGTYSLSVMHSDHATQTIDSVEIASEQATPVDIELTPAGLELPEFVVIEPFVEGSLASVIEEQRTSSGVSNVLGAEAISRAGDSDAAGALKRVTGLTLIDGQFVYVRGLGERYSSTLLNGANVPSPDPTRRVVPLDLFPADILASVVVQKSYEASLPAEFGGGNINLRTTGIPESNFVSISAGTEWHSQSTFDDGLTYLGGDNDWLGEDDGFRDFPNPDFEINDETTAALSNEVVPYQSKLEPDYGLGITAGYRRPFEVWDFGLLGAISYDQEWRNRRETRRSFSVRTINGEVSLSPLEDQDLDITRRFINLSGYLAAGLRIGEDHEFDLVYTLLRDTEDEAEIRIGQTKEADRARETTLEFERRQLEALQLFGSHQLPRLADLELSWQISDATTERDAPNAFNYEQAGDEDDFESFRFRGENTKRTWEDLEDNAKNYSVDLTLPVAWRDAEIKFATGANAVDKERDSQRQVFNYRCGNCRGLFELPLDELLDPEFIDERQLRLRGATLATDNYTAEQTVDAFYGSVDATWGKWRLYAGARQEDFEQTVTTINIFNPDDLELSELKTDDLYPAASLTWSPSDRDQFRFSYGETVTRPEFREVSSSLFNEARLDLTVQGNVDLVPSAITNYDFRWERYFDSLNNISVALFYKEIANPIELIDLGGAAGTVTFENGESADITGIEIEGYRSLDVLNRWLDYDWLSNFYVSGNYTWLDSEITLSEEQAGRLTNTSRALQGQSPFVANVQFGYDNEDRGISATLLYNTFGERITFVGVSGAPDILEQPADQLDFVYSQQLFDDRMKLSFKLKNLLDQRIEFIQGDEITREFKRGQSASVGLSWKF